MKVILKVRLCNHRGVFEAGDEYESTDKECKSLVNEGYAYYADEPKLEVATKEPTQNAATRTGRPRGRPKGSKNKKK